MCKKYVSSCHDALYYMVQCESYSETQSMVAAVLCNYTCWPNDALLCMLVFLLTKLRCNPCEGDR